MTKRYWWVIITYILMQLSAPIILFLVGLVQPDLIQTALTEEQLATLLTYWTIGSFVLTLVIVLFLMRPDMRMTQTRDRAPLGNLILWSVLGLFMAYFAQGIAAMLEMQIFGINPGSENTQMIMDIARAIPIFMIVPAIIAPILEEIIFRKIIFGTIYKRTNFVIAALMSAFIFGIIHGEPEHLLIYASMGFVFAFLYVKTKRILVPIFVHMALNTITVLVQYSFTPEDIEKMQEQLNQLQMIFIGG
ncbi:CPBP family intramembrane glutamic endopeptidase [Virgibacillus sp. LDC-1]|uniref:CPBP family intramembrane glutamic endopeptidase n=1 Tax=Virgibacillus sp. LDC-1 TaxID=3039856 RepID=UPI0024DECE63|nr:CPBP family intramembrane glutamic endopeptidase [Virgibacillus sp. LDC-1]